MNKKGIFFSLTIVLFLIVFIVLINNQHSVQTGKNELEIERSQFQVMNNFVSDFDQFYLGQILAIPLQETFIDRSAFNFVSFSTSDIEDIMQDGFLGATQIFGSGDTAKTTDSLFQQTLQTLSFEIPTKSLTYEIGSMQQISFNAFQVTFLVDYSFVIFDTTWQKQDKEVILTVPAFAITHHDPELQSQIDETWIANTGATTACVSGCLLSDLLSDFSIVACNGIPNIVPLTFTCPALGP